MSQTQSRIYHYISYFVDKCLANWLLSDPRHTSSKSPRYNYQLYEDTPYIYLCGGRFHFVKKEPYSICIGIVLVATGILYWVFEAPWAWHHQSPAVVIIFSYLWLLSLFYLLKGTLSDPGIQKRNLHIPFEPQNLVAHAAPDEYFDTISLPYYSDRYDGVTVKYCGTCHIWRLPRMSHCLICNVCIQDHDHHCVYLNNCVGRGNYRDFLWFLLIIVVACAYLGICMFLRCFSSHDESGDDTSKAFIQHHPVTLLLALISCVSIIYPFLLLILHLYLTAHNMTTREYLNHSRGNPDYVNVFDTHSIWNNLALNWLSKSLENNVVHPRDTPNNDLTTVVLPKIFSFSKGSKVESTFARAGTSNE